mmetsp:Transcript_48750/g.142156  ORF Transcript_48750/g.142156 Transcript_48750/m.142156 type:complete len:245 (+) Transcript_48750:119-853(+)
MGADPSRPKTPAGSAAQCSSCRCSRLPCSSNCSSAPWSCICRRSASIVSRTCCGSTLSVSSKVRLRPSLSARLRPSRSLSGSCSHKRAGWKCEGDDSCVELGRLLVARVAVGGGGPLSRRASYAGDRWPAKTLWKPSSDESCRMRGAGLAPDLGDDRELRWEAMGELLLARAEWKCDDNESSSGKASGVCKVNTPLPTGVGKSKSPRLPDKSSERASGSCKAAAAPPATGVGQRKLPRASRTDE